MVAVGGVKSLVYFENISMMCGKFVMFLPFSTDVTGFLQRCCCVLNVGYKSLFVSVL